MTIDKDEMEAIFPDFSPIIQEFEDMIQWKTVGKKKVPEPRPGLDENFDRANRAVEKVKHEIEEYLDTIKKELKTKNINYSTGSKLFRYEIEVADELCNKVPDHYSNTSNVKGRKRFQTDELRQMIETLEEKEEIFKDALVPFLREMFKKFYENREIFTRAV